MSHNAKNKEKVLDIFYKLRESVESRPYVLHWMEDTAKKMYGEDGRGRKDDLKKYKEDELIRIFKKD